MITVGAWWDLVDEIAVKRLGPIWRTPPEALEPTLLACAVDDDVWLRRSAIICQVGAKDATDTGLLTASVMPNMASKEFFLRKGIGWALREYAKTDPEWVRTFVDTHDDLSSLSRREATKHLTRPTGGN